MDVELTATLLQSGDPPQRNAAARDLGRSFAARPAGDWLLKFRRLAVKLQRKANADYDRGFLEALELVATGFERQTTEIRADESEVARIRTRAHWLGALRLLARGAQRPGELAARLEIHKSQVSKLIDELEDAGLVTQVAEGKERPCLITSRARVLLDQISDDPEDAVGPEKVVPVMVRCLGTLMRDGRMGRDRLLAMMQEELAGAATRALELLDESLRESAVGFHDSSDDALVIPELELQIRIAKHLEQARSGRPSTLLSRLEALTGESPVMLRIADGTFEWDIVAEQRLKGLQVVRKADLELDPPPLDHRFQVVYGSRSLVAEDRRSGRKALIQKATSRYCLGLDTTPPLKDFVAIEVQHPGLAVEVQHPGLAA